MKAARHIDEQEFVKRGVEVLFKELGPAEASRFIRISKGQRIESVKRHRTWQANLDKELFFKEVFVKE